MEVNAEKMRSAMINERLNVKALSRKSGVCEASINLILNHKRRARLDTIGKLALALNISGTELLKA